MALVRAGIKGWETNVEELPGKPDFFFHKKNIAVFVDGCFWHGCPKHYRAPKTNRAYWARKVARNRKTDKRKSIELRKEGWTVIRLWEHTIRKPSKILAFMKKNRKVFIPSQHQSLL